MTNNRKGGYPELLRSRSVGEVRNPAEWERYRRPELLALFREHIYGRCPFPVSDSMRYVKRASGLTAQGCLREEVSLYIGEYPLPVTVFLPVSGKCGKVMVYLRLANQSETELPVRMLTEKGYALIQVWTEDIASDSGECFQSGLFRYYPGKRLPDSCGAIGAWSYGLSRVMDWIETQGERLPARKVMVAGFSRGAKCSLWTAARDTRFALCAALHSGTGGAELCRDKRPSGETVADITKAFPYWFCDNFAKYGGNEELLPTDQHMLLGLIAPRGLFLSGGESDPWADMASEWRSLQMASPVYELYHKKPIAFSEDRRTNRLYEGDSVGYYAGAGGHSVTQAEWNSLLDFAERIFAAI